MSQFMGARFDTTAIDRALRDVERPFDRAAMYGVRAVGRRVKSVARKAAPVYQGDRPDIPKGRLKQAIGSSKRLRREGNMWVNKVGTRGYANFYSSKREAETHFIAAGQAAAEAEAGAIFERTFDRAVANWARKHGGR